MKAQTLEEQDIVHEKFENNSLSKIFDDTTPKNIKYSNAKGWIAKTFGDYKSVLQYEDPDNSRIVIKGFSALKDIVYFEDKRRITENPELSFTLTIDCKDDKYRLRIENMIVAVKKTTRIGLMMDIVSNETYDLAIYKAKGAAQSLAILENLTSMINSISNAIVEHDDF